MKNAFLGPELTSQEQPAYSPEQVRAMLDAIISDDSARERAIAAFGNMNIGGYPVYIGKRKGNNTKYSSDKEHVDTNGNTVRAIFVGCGDKKVGDSLGLTLRTMLNLLWHSKNEGANVSEKQKAEMMERRKIISNGIIALAGELLTNPGGEKIGYMWAFLGDDIDDFLGETTTDEIINELISNTMAYIDYRGNVAEVEQA